MSSTTLKASTKERAMCKRKTTAEYAAQVAALGKGITVVGEYKLTGTKIAHKCAEGHQWGATPNNILRGSGCPHCAGQIPAKPYQQRLDDMGKGFIAIGEYKNSHTKITHQCAEGHEWDAPPGVILHGRGCPHCAGQVPDKPYQQRLDELGSGFVALGEYDGAHKRIAHQCSRGHQWDASPTNVLRVSGCPECAEHGYKLSKPALLYVLEHKLPDGRTRTNIGITNRTVEERYDVDALDTITRRTTIEGHGVDVRKLEQSLHEMLSDHLDARGFGFKTKKGSKECFDYPFEAAAKLAHYKGSPVDREVGRAVSN